MQTQSRRINRELPCDRRVRDRASATKELCNLVQKERKQRRQLSDELAQALSTAARGARDVSQIWPQARTYFTQTHCPHLRRKLHQRRICFASQVATSPAQYATSHHRGRNTLHGQHKNLPVLFHYCMYPREMNCCETQRNLFSKLRSNQNNESFDENHSH